MPTTSNYGFEYESPSSLPGTSVTGGPGGGSPILAVQVDSALTTLDARVSATETTGYRYLTTEVFGASGSFTKATYPGIRAVRVYLVGAGGQCGGCAATAAGQSSEGGAGGGGGYAESFLLEGALAANITVTIGAGGTGGGAGATGNAGGSTSFGAILSATGGGGGVAMGAVSGNAVNDGGSSGLGSSGNILNLAGGIGGAGLVVGGTAMRGNMGGASRYGASAQSGATNTNGEPGLLYGSGGGCTRNGASQAARAGANGAPGLVIVDVYV